MRITSVFILVLHKILINPKTFRPVKISMEDVEENSSISINYGDLMNFSEKLFPESMILNFTSESNNIALKLKFQKIDFDVPV